MTAAPKYTEKPGGGDEPDTPVTYTAVKLWAGEKSSDKRPGQQWKSPSAGTAWSRKGGRCRRSTIGCTAGRLSAAHGAFWSEMSRRGYTVTAQRSGSSFFVTNTHSAVPDPIPTPEPTPKPTPGPGDRPQTGDESHLTLYIVCMAVSGLALLLLGVLNRNQKHEKK